MSNVETILESIEKLTLLEAAELVKAMEEKFGVSAAAPVAVAAAPAAGAADAGEAADAEVTVVLASKEAIVGDNIIADGFDNGKCVLGLICQDREAMLASTKGLLDRGVEKYYSGHGGPFTKEEVLDAYQRASKE